MTNDVRPPCWAEAALCMMLQPRDRDTITGDLLEEYREAVVPAVGVSRARLWYLRNALSLVTMAGCRRLVERLVVSRKSSVLWIGAALAAAGVLLLMLARTNWGPPRVPLVFVQLGAAGLAVCAATALRPAIEDGLLWRVGMIWGALFAAAIAVRMLFDLVAPLDVERSFLSSHVPDRGVILGAGIAVIFLAAGFAGAWRSGRVRAGTLTAMASSAIGSTITVIVATVVFEFLFAVRRPGTPAQVFSIANGIQAPLVVLMFSTVLGTIGAMFGRGLSGLLRR